MKKLIIVCLGFGLSGAGYGAQPTAIGNVKAKRVSFEPYTVTQMNLLQPDTTGQLIFVTDGIQSKICISTASSPSTAIGAFVVIQATAPGAGALQHCQ